jgi:HK97 family phage prohead protease
MKHPFAPALVLHRKDAGAVGLQHKEFGFKAGVVKEDGTFDGYGSVFGNVDSYGEIVAPGAFKKSLAAIKASGDPVPALWQHRSGEPIGGYTDLTEDDRGLKVEGFLVLEDPVAKRAHLYMQKRIVKGLSIGYYVRDSSYDEKTGIRTLKELDLVEISIVTFPANAEAQVESVKSTEMQRILKSGNLPTLPQLEDLLCEAGFSKTQAKAVAGHGLRKLLDRREAEGKSSDTLSALKGFTLPSFQ